MMGRFVWTALATGCVALLLSGCGARPVVRIPVQTDARSEQTALPIDTSVFEKPERLQRTMLEAQAQSDRSGCKAFRAGVVNHHTLADDLLADFFTRLAACRSDVQTVIILSPDHFHNGRASIATLEVPYRVGEDLVFADTTTTQDMRSSLPFAEDNEDLFRKEHGVGALVPFLHRVLPHARFVALALSANISEADAQQTSDWLRSELANPSTFIVVSSDMSHYLNEAHALANDQQTLNAFAENNVAFFWNAQDSHTDSGRTLSIVLRALGTTAWHERKERISSQYGGDTLYTTSYLTGFWE